MYKKFIALLLVIFLLSSSAYFVFPQVTNLSDKTGLAVSFAIFISQAVAAWYFLTSLGAFKKGLRIAYAILASGIFLFALNQLQLPAGTFIELDPILTAWYIVSSTTIGSILMYLGAWKFARLLQIHSFWSSLLAIAGFSLALALATSFAPHEDIGLDESLFDGIFCTYIIGAGFCIGATALALQLRKKLGKSYTKAITWLAAGFAIAAIASVHETAIRLLPLSTALPSFYFDYTINLLPYFVVAILFLKAGLLFKETSVELGKLPENATYLDVINYAAQIASSPAELDVALDKVREVTATQAPGKEMSAADKSKLLTVYLQIEEYLTTKEPLRKLSKEDLRARLPEEFQEALGDTSKSRASDKDA